MSREKIKQTDSVTKINYNNKNTKTVALSKEYAYWPNNKKNKKGD